MAQQSNKQSSNHSFYREAKKSFYGSEGFSKEKGWKLTKKFTKWALYGFLTITTLWGCVNEFIIKTGNQIGTGVEFYSSSNEVLPNIFESDTEMVWEATGKQDDEILGTANGDLQEWEGTELKPFDMVTFNPYYGADPDETDIPDGIKTGDPIISSQDAGQSNIGQISGSIQYGMYNLDQLTNNKVDEEGKKSLYTAPTASDFPEGLKTEEIKDEAGEVTTEGITTWSDFYVDKLVKGELYDPNDEEVLNGEIEGEDTDNPTFIDPRTDKYFDVRAHKKTDEVTEEVTYDTVITPYLGGMTWYAMPIEDDPNGNWKIVADSAITYEGMIKPTITPATDTTLEEITEVSTNNVNAFATNTAIRITNELAYYTGEEITFETKIGDLLGMDYGDGDVPMMQIKNSQALTEKEKEAGIEHTYKEFYEYVGDISNPINQNTTIWEIAQESTWSYIEQFTESQGDGKEIDNYYEDITEKSDIVGILPEDDGYVADYTKLLTSEGWTVHNGQAYKISPVNSKEPTIPTYDALYTMQNLRPTGWSVDKDVLRNSKKLNDIYVDPLAQMAGWGLLDENGNLRVVANDEYTEEYYIIQQVYDDPNVNFYNSDKDENGKKGSYVYDNTEQKYGELSEDLYYQALEPLFAMQRTDDWASDHGTEVSPPVNSNYEDKNVDENFDQMMFNYANGVDGNTFSSYFETPLNNIKIYVTDEETSGINYNQYEIAYSTPIAGIETNTRVGNKTPDYKDDYDEVERGTTTPVSFTNQDIHKTALDSSLYNSGSKGIDEGNTSRGIFAGWSDWGWAWNIKFGPLYGLFLFPISQIALFVQHVIFPFHIFGAWGVLLGVFFIVFFLRGVGSLMSFKSTSNQQKMQEVQVEVAKINAKYEKYGDNKQMKQRKQMEVMALYRKKEINPLGSFGTIFITMPIFISMWILISAIPVYKIAAIGSFSFSISALSGIFSSLFILYILVGVSVGLMQGLSAKLPGWLAQKRKGIKQVTEAEKKAAKKQNKTQNIMVGVFIVIGLTVPVLLAFYWISSAIFTICLELARHEYQVRKGKKVKQEK